MNLKKDKKPDFISNIILGAEKSLDKAKLCKAVTLRKVENAELKKYLQTLYRQKIPKVRVTASVLNAIFYELKPVFLLSKTTLGQILESDSNLKRSTVGNEFGEFQSFWLSQNILKKIFDGVPFNGMSAYELVQPELKMLFVKMYGEKLFEEKRSKCIEVLEVYAKKNSVVLPKRPSHEGEGDSENENKSDGESVNVPKAQNQPALILKTEENHKAKATSPFIIHDLRYVDTHNLKKAVALVSDLPKLSDWEKNDFLNGLPEKIETYGKLTESQIDKIAEIIFNRGGKILFYQKRFSESETLESLTALDDQINYKVSRSLRKFQTVTEEVKTDCKKIFAQTLKSLNCQTSDQEIDSAWENKLKSILEKSNSL